MAKNSRFFGLWKSSAAKVDEELMFELTLEEEEQIKTLIFESANEEIKQSY